VAVDETNFRKVRFVRGKIELPVRKVVQRHMLTVHGAAVNSYACLNIYYFEEYLTETRK